MATTDTMCREWIKNRGKAVYGSHRCTKPATRAGLCERHAAAFDRGCAKLAAYARKGIIKAGD